MPYVPETELKILRRKHKLLRQEVLMYQRVMEGMRRNHSLEGLLKTVIQSVRKGLGFKRAGVFLLQEDGKSIHLAMGVDQAGRFEKDKDRQPISSRRGENVFSDLISGHQKFFLTNQVDRRISRFYPNSRYRVSVLNNAVVPIQVGRGRMIGALAVDNLMTDRPITRSDVSSLMNYATQAGLAIESHWTHERILNQSITDPLTGLYNRRFFDRALNQEMARCQRYRRACSLIMADIDHFKRVNDAHGHQAGDEIIRQVAGLLRDNTRGLDVVGRYGGEEFAILLPETPPHDISSVARRILRMARQMKPAWRPMAKDGQRVTVSLGISSFRGGMATVAEMVRRADKSLYLAKQSGRDRCGAAQVLKGPVRRPSRGR